MANQLQNATFLDGPTGWTAGSGLSVLATGQGGRGRLVLAGTTSLLSSRIPLSGATQVWAMAHHLGGALRVRFSDAAGAGAVNIDVPVIDPAKGPAERGRPSGFNFSKARIIAPAGATHFALGVFGGAVRLLKPYASTDAREPLLWQPGPHANPDLNLPAWPAHLPLAMDEGLQADPIPSRKGFAGDSGVEMTRRMTRSRRYQLQAQYGLDSAQRDALLDFFDDTPGSFYFTRPDTREVCIAQWMADGEPVLAGQLPGRRRVQVKLQVKVP